MATNSDKVTIYAKGAAGNIGRHEVHFVRVVDHGTNGADVVFRKRRGRAEYVVSSFYSSFWAVVDGWGHPKPDSLYARTEETAAGVTVSYGRYRSCDPSWIADFLSGAGATLKFRAMFHNGVLQFGPDSGIKAIDGPTAGNAE